jgi:hypothetical protein
MTMQIGREDYRLGGLERLKDSGQLLRSGSYAGCIYLAGRAVEGMLRAVVWKADAGYSTGKKSLDTGHDLKKLLQLVANLGILQEGEHRKELASNIQYVARLWFNNLRYVSTEQLQRNWRQSKEIHSQWTLKQATESYYNACSKIVKRCEALCIS